MSNWREINIVNIFLETQYLRVDTPIQVINNSSKANEFNINCQINV